MDKLKFIIGSLLALFLGLSCYLVFQLIIFVQDTKISIARAKPALTSTLTNIEHASLSVASSAKDLSETSKAQNELLTNPKTQRAIGLLLRSGDDLSRTIKKFNIALDQVNNQTLPNTNQAIKTANSTLASADHLLQTTDLQIDRLGEQAQQDLKDLSQLLTDPHLLETIKNLSATSEEVKEICKNLNISTQELNQSLPEILKQLKEILQHIDDGTEASATFIQGLSKPLTKKQKLYRAAIQILAIAAPAILRR